MSGIAVLCSGQGHQGPHMFDLIAEAPEAQPVFAAATDALGGRDPREIAGSGNDEIYRNDIAQVLCCTSALAWWAVLPSRATMPLTIAGYSAGELPAWGIACAIDTSQLMNLVLKRASLMDAAVDYPSGLAVVLGLTRDAISALCDEHGLYVAIVNGPLESIIGGRSSFLETAIQYATAKGAHRAAMLPVHVASHTPLMNAAKDKFDGLLRGEILLSRIRRGVRLISSIDGAPVVGVGEGLHKLSAQMATTVNWAACMDACRRVSPTCAIELGPGDALAKMMNEAAPDLPARSVADFRSIDGVRNWLSMHA